VGSAPAGGPPPTARARLDLNTATAAELDALPGIGPVLAARIVEHRRLHGAFRSVEELRSVPGIGPRLLARLRPSLREPPG
jgi:competence protein ComEA